MKQRPVIKDFVISKHRYYELMHMCLQYREWKDMLKYLEPSAHSQTLDESGKRVTSENVEKLAIKRKEISEKCDIVENAARRAGIIHTKSGNIDISDYILKSVTNEGITYEYLDRVMNIPVGRTVFYRQKRKFFYILSELCK